MGLAVKETSSLMQGFLYLEVSMLSAATLNGAIVRGSSVVPKEGITAETGGEQIKVVVVAFLSHECSIRISFTVTVL
jgi:hypothetical protein